MLDFDWDKSRDILYIRLGDTSNSKGDRDESGFVILKDLKTKEITGITIFDFAKRSRARH